MSKTTIIGLLFVLIGFVGGTIIGIGLRHTLLQKEAVCCTQDCCPLDCKDSETCPAYCCDGVSKHDCKSPCCNGD